ncbi:hypothetical protein Trydic_g17501 [Trypoxylus dichotomus]
MIDIESTYPEINVIVRDVLTIHGDSNSASAGKKGDPPVDRQVKVLNDSLLVLRRYALREYRQHTDDAA